MTKRLTILSVLFVSSVSYSAFGAVTMCMPVGGIEKTSTWPKHFSWDAKTHAAKTSVFGNDIEGEVTRVSDFPTSDFPSVNLEFVSKNDGHDLQCDIMEVYLWPIGQKRRAMAVGYDVMNGKRYLSISYGTVEVACNSF